MNYALPTTVEIGGKEYEIRSDYRAVLDIMAALSDAELDNDERGYAVMAIFYPEMEEIPPSLFDEAIKKCFWFINGGEDEQDKAKQPQLVDWNMDLPRIIPPMNRVLGTEIRALDYMHWWTFLGAYMELGDCLFAQIVGIRAKKAKGKTLDKADQEFYNKNRDIIEIKKHYTQTQNEILDRFT